MHSGLKCEVEKLGGSWFNKNSLTNIFSLTYLVDKFRIKYDYKIEDAFLVYVNNKKVKFKILEKRIYGMCTGTTDDKKKKLLIM